MATPISEGACLVVFFSWCSIQCVCVVCHLAIRASLIETYLLPTYPWCLLFHYPPPSLLSSPLAVSFRCFRLVSSSFVTSLRLVLVFQLSRPTPSTIPSLASTSPARHEPRPPDLRGLPPSVSLFSVTIAGAAEVFLLGFLSPCSRPISLPPLLENRLGRPVRRYPNCMRCWSSPPLMSK